MSDKGELDRLHTYDGIFVAWRDDGAPTLYDSNRTAVGVDVLEVGFIFSAVLLAVCFLLTLPGVRGCTEKSIALIKIALGIYITLVIFLCNFGMEWEHAELHTKTPLRAGTNHEIEATIEVRIGLRSANITLVGDPEYQALDEYTTEQINYNERFDWSLDSWQQGRGGFGPFAGAVNQEFREAQLRGVPYPILWIAEYFTIDGEGIRWGRYYRQAGFYAHIMLWFAFPCWILTMILFQSVLFYGVLFSWLTGACHICACLIFAFVRNPTDLKIPFEDGALEFSWGWTFWLCLVNGLICMIIGVAVLVCDVNFPDETASFFGLDSLNDFEEYYVSADELQQMGIEIDPGTPSTSPDSTLDGESSSQGSKGNLIKKSTANNISREQTNFFPSNQKPNLSDDEDDKPQVIQMFRRKSKTGSIHHLVSKAKNTLTQRKSAKSRTPITNVAAAPFPRPGSGKVNPAFENTDQQQRPGLADGQRRVTKVMWRILPQGTTIKAKYHGNGQPHAGQPVYVNSTGFSWERK